MLPSPVELTYFSEVADSLNLSRTSKRLGVTQPSLSLAIKRLEHTLGLQLFIRHKQGVSLTPAGEKLLSQVKPLLQYWENTKINVRDTHQHIQGRVTIGCRSATALLMGGFLKNLLHTHPNLEVSFKFQNAQKIAEGVIHSTIDIGLISNPPQHPDLIIHKINDVEMSFWVGAGNSPLQAIDSGQAVIICESNAPMAQTLLRKIGKDNRRIARTINVNSLEVVAHFTMEGCGIGILPSCFEHPSYHGKLTRLTDLPSATSDICLIYRHENKNVAAIKAITNAIRNYRAES